MLVGASQWVAGNMPGESQPRSQYWKGRSVGRADNSSRPNQQKIFSTKLFGLREAHFTHGRIHRKDHEIGGLDFCSDFKNGGIELDTFFFGIAKIDQYLGFLLVNPHHDGNALTDQFR